MASSTCIAQLDVAITDQSFREDRVIVSSAGRHARSRFVVVTVTAASGCRGWGEGATMALWSGETPESAQALIESTLKSLVVGATFDHPSEIVAVLDKACVGNPFAKAAVDCAVWDLWGRENKIRIVDEIADREPVTSIPIRASIGAFPPEDTLARARGLWDEGVRVLKFKTGTPDVDDVARLQAVRDELGPEPVFTIDYNGGCGHNADAAVHSIEALAPFDLALVEQPTHRDRISLLAEVKKRIDIPLLADEAVFTPDQLREAIDLDAFDIMGLYPGKNGGFTHSLSMAKAVAAVGKHCAIGSDGETVLGEGAMATLAAGLEVFPVEQIPCDLQAAVLYADPVSAHPDRYANGRVTVPTGTGFGVEP